MEDAINADAGAGEHPLVVFIQQHQQQHHAAWGFGDGEIALDEQLVDPLDRGRPLHMVDDDQQDQGQQQEQGGGPSQQPVQPAEEAQPQIPAEDMQATAGEDAVLAFSDEDDENDTTAEQVATAGKDIQGIPWARLQFTRAHYRKTRLKQYRNYTNVLPEDPEEYRPELLKKCKQPSTSSTFFHFVHNNRAVRSNIVHFQLRNLVWAASRNDVFLTHQNCVNHWNPVTRTLTEVVNLAGGGTPDTRPPGLGKVQISTLCVRAGLVATGGFSGELCVRRLGGDAGAGSCWAYSGRVTNSENGITNGLEVFDSACHGVCVMAANNDAKVRVYAASHTFQHMCTWTYPWAVNYATLRPEGHLVAVVGDDPATILTDMRQGGAQQVAALSAHDDYSFAAAWHPHGNLLATGNQDTTTVVWDVRHTAAPLARLAGRMGAIRSLRWSGDGRFLAASEPADFVHVYDAAHGFNQAQEIDLFGEISGVSFTPLGDTLFVGIADITYASLLTFERGARPGGAAAAAAAYSAFPPPHLAHLWPQRPVLDHASGAGEMDDAEEEEDEVEARARRMIEALEEDEIEEDVDDADVVDLV